MPDLEDLLSQFLVYGQVVTVAICRSRDRNALIYDPIGSGAPFIYGFRIVIEGFLEDVRDLSLERPDGRILA